ncbi:MAG: hypothetical protein JEY97_12110 [Bacteroidales bacterium]|nr:hypothetical protein [Bacteroidales bacterium]
MNRNNSFIIFIIIVLASNLHAQVNDLSKLNTLPKNGLIKLINGNEIGFNKFKFQNDTVFIHNNKNVRQKIPVKNIYTVTKKGNYSLTGTLSCAAGGLIGAVIGTSGEKYRFQEKKEEYIIGVTIACGIFGGIIGALIKREKVIYQRNNSDFGINSIIINPIWIPTVIENFGNSGNVNNPVLMIGVNIKI